MNASPAGHDLTLGAPIARMTRRARDESALVRQAKRGSADAVEALVRRHWDGAHRAAYLIVRDAAAAEDIAQEALLAAVGRIGDFDRRRAFAPWLHRIVVNRSLDWLRARERRGEVGGEALAATAAPAVDRDAAGELMAALGVLEPEQRALIVLRHLHGYSSSELARLLDLPAATVRTRLARAVHRLQALVDVDPGERA
jgi:RNA polymerase sigma-70 factor (ECF subfamily)